MPPQHTAPRILTQIRGSGPAEVQGVAGPQGEAGSLILHGIIGTIKGSGVRGGWEGGGGALYHRDEFSSMKVAHETCVKKYGQIQAYSRQVRLGYIRIRLIRLVCYGSLS